MLVLNAGPEKIEFGFNMNAMPPHHMSEEQRKKVLGGNYIIEPGKTAHVPDEAHATIVHHVNSPSDKGLVVLEFGDNEDEKKVQGLQNYIKAMNEVLMYQLKRGEEEEQVGTKKHFEDPKVIKFKQKIAVAQEMLDNLLTKNTEKQEVKENGDSSSNGKQSSKKLG